MDRRGLLKNFLGAAVVVAVGKKLDWVPVPVDKPGIAGTEFAVELTESWMRMKIPRGLFLPNDIISTSQGESFWVTRENGQLVGKHVYSHFTMLLEEVDYPVSKKAIKMCSCIEDV